MPDGVLVEVVRGQPPQRYAMDDLRRAITSGLVAPMVFASVDGGATWVRAHEAAGLPASAPGGAATGGAATAGDALVLRMVLPVGRSVWAIVAGYWGLLTLFLALFWVAPLADASARGPFPTDLLWVAAVMLVVFVLPTAGTAALGHRAIRKDASKHGMGRVVFAYVAAGLHAALMIGAIVAVAVRR